MKRKDYGLPSLPPQNYDNIFSVAMDEDGYYYYNLLRVVNFPVDMAASAFKYYTSVTNDTWPLIAWKHYSDVKLWWIVCAANQIQNPAEHPVPGTKLKIIEISAIKNLLNQLIV